jgi:hypothetical protein
MAAEKPEGHWCDNWGGWLGEIQSHPHLEYIDKKCAAAAAASASTSLSARLYAKLYNELYAPETPSVLGKQMVFVLRYYMTFKGHDEQYREDVVRALAKIRKVVRDRNKNGKDLKEYLALFKPNAQESEGGHQGNLHSNTPLPTSFECNVDLHPADYGTQIPQQDWHNVLQSGYYDSTHTLCGDDCPHTDIHTSQVAGDPFSWDQHEIRFPINSRGVRESFSDAHPVERHVHSPLQPSDYTQWSSDLGQ